MEPPIVVPPARTLLWVWPKYAMERCIDPAAAPKGESAVAGSSSQARLASGDRRARQRGNDMARRLRHEDRQGGSDGREQHGSAACPQVSDARVQRPKKTISRSTFSTRRATRVATACGLCPRSGSVRPSADHSAKVIAAPQSTQNGVGRVGSSAAAARRMNCSAASAVRRIADRVDAQ